MIILDCSDHIGGRHGVLSKVAVNQKYDELDDVLQKLLESKYLGDSFKLKNGIIIIMIITIITISYITKNLHHISGSTYSVHEFRKVKHFDGLAGLLADQNRSLVLCTDDKSTAKYD